jgi:hypothetical protein
MQNLSNNNSEVKALKTQMILQSTLILGSVILLFVMITPTVIVLGQTSQTSDIWQVYDVVEPSVDQVKWSEQGVLSSPASWIADGTWVIASMRQSLVSGNDIFVSLYERFDWSKVQSSAEQYYGTQFNSFGDFAAAIQTDTSPWLSLAWEMDTQWYGISQNTTKVTISIDSTSGLADLSLWFHITRVPEYLSGDKVTNWLTGFDLTSISIGNLRLWELYEDWSSSGTAYKLQFEAPASILSQHGNNYTCNLGVAASFVGKSFKIDQVIDVNMPAETVTKEFSPLQLSVFLDNNVGSFVLQNGDIYPAAFTVTSSPPTKNALAEIVSAWFTTPAGLAAIASLIVLSVTAMRGRRIYGRSRQYRRLYRGMVTLYDLYNKDETRFHTEMDSISKNIFKMMVNDKITDDQFEKLLERRDDLLERADKQHPPPPPTRL